MEKIQKIKTVKKIRFADYKDTFNPTVIVVPEKHLEHFLEEKDKEYLKDWDEIVLVDDVFHICIARHLKSTPVIIHKPYERRN